MSYSESKNYLYSLGNELSTKKFGLQNTIILLNALGNPQQRFFKVQVAGTNGKGSTCAFLSSITTNAKIKTGLFTSPHLIEPTERIRLNDQDISKELFAKHATIVREVAEKLVVENKLKATPTFFEQITAIALLAFQEAGVKLAVLETGLGGRFDATTGANAEIAAITQIDLDHTNILGETITEIAQEKAEIIRSDSKAVLINVNQSVEAIAVFEQKAAQTQINLEYVPINQELPRLSLLGEHQKINASLAVAIATRLNHFGFNVTKQHINFGLQNTRHAGRLENRDGILFDGAHNLAGVKSLAKFLKSEIGNPIILIFGAMKDKNITEMTKVLFPLADQVILTTVNQPRAIKASEITQLLPKEVSGQFIHVTDSVQNALQKASDLSLKTPDSQIVISGSLYLIGEAQEIMQNKNEE